MDVLGPLPKTESGTQFVVAMMDRFSKFTREIPATERTASHIASVFLYHLVFLHGIPQFILSDNGPQFLYKFFSALCGFLGCEKL